VDFCPSLLLPLQSMNNSTAPAQVGENPRVKFLLWGIAFGPLASKLVQIWLDSLLRIGKWEHDIVLLGDENVLRFRAARLRTINIRKDVQKRYNLHRRRWTHWTYNNLKSQILRYVDIAAYQYLLYLDLDVLANSSRLEDLVRAKYESGMICAQRDCISLTDGRIRALRKLGVPCESERIRWAERPICAGIMGFPTSPIGLSALRDYHKACVQMRFKWSDQAKLVALLNREYPGAWDFLGDTVHGRRIAPPYDETLVHFTGPRKSLMTKYFSARIASLGETSE
jgi:hypothetical protein